MTKNETQHQGSQEHDTAVTLEAATAAAVVAGAAATAGPAVLPPQAVHNDSTFKKGEAVFVKRYGNAVIVSGPVQERGHEFYGRYQVQYPDGKVYYARPNVLCRFEQPPSRVLVAETTDHYRAAAQLYAHPGDVVLEVGSSYGITCDLIHQRSKFVVGVDKSLELVQAARVKYPHIQFEQLDAFNLEALQSLSPTGSFDKIFIDIGGIAELHTVMGLLGLYFKAFRTAVLIVKSKYLKTLLQHVQVFVPKQEQEQRAAKQQKQQQHNAKQQQKHQKQQQAVCREQQPQKQQKQLQQPQTLSQQKYEGVVKQQHLYEPKQLHGVTGQESCGSPSLQCNDRS